jgi:hypothetical protein
MTSEDLKLLRDVQAKDDEEMALQEKSARYRNSDKKLFETVVARVEHVISELLQNADDAEATKVRIAYVDGVLTFQHDGKDFEDDQFRSICSFAVSSKRTFKTTGFRGIGFKSTFSLGDTVHLITPRFQVRFERARFTYPVPLDGEKPDEDYRITIRVPVRETSRRELESSLKVWRTAPCSLLFFKNLKVGVTIGTDHFVVNRAKKERSLHTIAQNGKDIWEGHLRSKTGIKLPADACEEIAALRGAAVESDEDSQTELDVLASEDEAGRIYSILPTSGERRLQTSFALNSSFVLTPERDGIKSPSQSPTNRFLFAEAGRFVADNLITALGRASEFSENLLRAYELLPLDGDWSKPDGETEASRVLRDACLAKLSSEKWVVTADFRFVCPGRVALVQLPAELLEVWPLETIAELFANDAGILHPEMPKKVVVWLKTNGYLTTPPSDILLGAITKRAARPPQELQKLYKLWSWAARAIITNDFVAESQVATWSAINILPAEGEDFLKPLGSVLNFSKETAAIFADGGVELKQLALYRFDTDSVPAADLILKTPPQGWWKMMNCGTVKITKELGLANMLTVVAQRLAAQMEKSTLSKDLLKAVWRIHQEAGVPIHSDLPVLRENGTAIPIGKSQLMIRSAALKVEDYLPADAIARIALAENLYPDTPAEREAFCEWLVSSGSAVCFPKPVRSNISFSNSYQASHYAMSLGGFLTDAKNGAYELRDHDWPKELTVFWALKAASSSDYYETVVQMMIRHQGHFLKQNRFGEFSRCYGGYWSGVTCSPAIPRSWARFFRDKPCLRSTSGELRKPIDLFLLKPGSTAYLINAGEPAISAELYDAYGEEFLSLLGCRATLPGLPELTRIIKAEIESSAPRTERIRWLLLAANAVFTNSPDDGARKALLSLLAEHASIPSTAGKLERPDTLVQEAGDDETVAVLAVDLRGTAIAAALEIRQSPSRESDIAWVDQSIEVDDELSREKLKRLKKLLSQPSSVSEHLWKQRKWLALDGVVRSLDDFDFVHADLSELPVDKIVDESVLARTADFSVIEPLPDELRAFSKPALIACLDCEIDLREGAEKIEGGWLGAIAQVLWTEAANAGENQEILEAQAIKWRDAGVLLDPSLCQRFTRNGKVVAAGIKLDAEWVDDSSFAIRADDEDAVCELTEEIAKRLRQPLLSFRTKTGAKLPAWVTRREGQIKKLGIKALQVAELRPWPETVTEDNTPAVSEDEGAAETGGAPDQHDAVAQDTKSPESQATDSLGFVPRSTPISKTVAEVSDDPQENDSRPSPRSSDAANSGEAQEGGDPDSPNPESEYSEARRHRGQRHYAATNGERQRSTEHDPARSRSDTPPAPQSGERMRSYVEHSMDRRARERQRTQAQENGAAAEEFVVAWEQKQGRSATRLGGNNPGYDIASRSKDGEEERFIEVKSIAGEWGGTGVRLTPTQFACAEHYGDRYWLYVIEDAKTGRPIVHAIQDPAAHISAFCFDCGWREIAEAATKEKPPSLFVPKVGETVIFGDDEVVVDKVETRGVFSAVFFQHDGSERRVMNTAIFPKE